MTEKEFEIATTLINSRNELSEFIDAFSSKTYQVNIGVCCNMVQEELLSTFPAIKEEINTHTLKLLRIELGKIKNEIKKYLD